MPTTGRERSAIPNRPKLSSRIRGTGGRRTSRGRKPTSSSFNGTTISSRNSSKRMACAALSRSNQPAMGRTPSLSRLRNPVDPSIALKRRRGFHQRLHPAMRSGVVRRGGRGCFEIPSPRKCSSTRASYSQGACTAPIKARPSSNTGSARRRLPRCRE